MVMVEKCEMIHIGFLSIKILCEVESETSAAKYCKVNVHASMCS